MGDTQQPQPAGATGTEARQQLSDVPETGGSTP